MPNRSPPLDGVFRALSDPTRRAVVARLCRGPASMSELAEPHPMSLPSFAQHLDVLESCGLVKSSKEGRVRTFKLTPRTLDQASRWLDKQRAQWTTRLDQLDALVADEARTPGRSRRSSKTGAR